MSRMRTVALLPWGDLIEDFLDQIGVSLETFCTEMDGGWMFGYVEALRRAGVRIVVICVSARVDKPTPFTHGPTGAQFWVLPASKLFLRMRRRVKVPYGWTLEEMFGGTEKETHRLGNRLNRDVTPYFATPPRLLSRVLQQERCEVVLCQEYEYPRFDIAVAVGRRLGLPVFATFQGGDRLQRYLAAADVYAFPSRDEGFPVALVEALAAGLPPAAAAAPGGPDILNTDDLAACMVPTEDAEALAATLGRLLDDRTLRDRLGTAARARAVEAFSLEAVGAQFRHFLSGASQSIGAGEGTAI